MRNSPDELDKEFMMQNYITPRDSSSSARSLTRKSLTSMTRVVKGNDGKTIVNNVADVEADTLEDEKDMFVISDEEVEREMRTTPRTPTDVGKSPRSSSMTPRTSLLGLGSK